MTELSTLISLYKKDGITGYVIEKEFNEYLGDRFLTKIVDEKQSSTALSYGVSIAPEKRKNGVFINVLIDKTAIYELYTANEIVGILTALKEMRQEFFKEFRVVSNARNDVPLSKVLVAFLKIYLKIMPILLQGEETRSFLPDVHVVESIIERLEEERGLDEILEAIRVKDILPNYAVDIARQTAAFTQESILPTGENGQDIPAMNVFRAQRAAVCNPSSVYNGGHTEIPYDYLPSTNQ